MVPKTLEQIHMICDIGLFVIHHERILICKKKSLKHNAVDFTLAAVSHVLESTPEQFFSTALHFTTRVYPPSTEMV
jgi:hypothetical protein